MTYLGVARADGIVTDPIGTSPQGFSIYDRPLGSGFLLVAEARRGPDFLRVGSQTFVPNGLPDFRLVASRPLGNGSTIVCDDGSAGLLGGVPAVVPIEFGAPAAAALNDMGCRFTPRGNDGDACTRDFTAVSSFVESTSQIQFCSSPGVGTEIAFPPGDTVLTVRIANIAGQLGEAVSIVIRVQ